jgi:hypothetical protein
MEGRVSWQPEGAGAVVEQIGEWGESGASHVTVNTMGVGLRTVDDHLHALDATAEALGLRK